MKTLFSLILLAFAGSIVSAQELDVPVGFVKVVNAVSTGMPSRIKLGDIDIYAGDDMEPGDASGFIGLEPGEYPYRIVNLACIPNSLEGKIKIENGKTVAIVFHADAKEKREGVIEHRLAATLLNKESQEEGLRVSLVSLSKKPLVNVQVGKNTLSLAQKRAVDLTASPDQTVSVKYNDEAIGEIVAIDGLHSMGFLFDVEGGIGMETIVLEKIEYVPPKESFDDDEEEISDPTMESPETPE